MLNGSLTRVSLESKFHSIYSHKTLLRFIVILDYCSASWNQVLAAQVTLGPLQFK